MHFLVAMVLASGPAHPELGRVSWLRDLDAGLEQARATGKPVLLLFDEVPGCSTVRGFGRDVLSDPEVVALIEARFVPVAIFNNVSGADRRVLDEFREPAWNNPVVRVLDAQRRPLGSRFDGPYTKGAFREQLDRWLEGRAPKLERLTVSAHCFWECEARLGRLPAVQSSRVGFLGGEEVVEVEFDASRTSRQALVDEAIALDCATHVFTRSSEEHALLWPRLGARAVRTDEPLRASAKDTKYYLRRSGQPTEGLSPLEQTRVNAALRFGEDPAAARASCRSAK
ncbi:MAG: thioredoxin family protein [Myxococcaceae bacterium]|nr:thioredoxin family protein [Myxococcaceae bacterium]